MFFKTNNNKYMLSEKQNMFLYLPPKFAEDKTEENSTSYYKKKYDFLKKNGFYDDFEPTFKTEYGEQKIKTNLANLRMLLIEVTDNCNLACKYCGYRDYYINYDQRNSKKQTFGNIKILIDYMTRLWRSPLNISYNNVITIGFYGGEPLLAFSLIQKTIDYIDENPIPGLRFEYNMTTNGVLLNRYIDYLAEKKINLLISLDGNEKNNAYRLDHASKPSFSTVFSNALILKQKYPDYFQNHVQFNTVLHNLNSVKSSYSFIYEIFGKSPRFGELNTNGLNPKKKKDFIRMFKNKILEFKKNTTLQEKNHEFKFMDPKLLLLSNFIDSYTGNSFHCFADLFIDKTRDEYVPTGTCHPFARKLFLTVNGKILPCEKIGHSNILGKIAGDNLEINFEKINSFYKKNYEEIIVKCQKCIRWHNCSYCIYLMPHEEERISCDRYLPRNKSIQYLTFYIKELEEKPYLYNELITNLYKQ